MPESKTSLPSGIFARYVFHKDCSWLVFAAGVLAIIIGFILSLDVQFWRLLN